MSAARALLPLVLLALSAGCLAGPRLVLDDAQLGSAEHDPARGVWSATVRGSVANLGDQDLRGVTLFVGLAPSCAGPPVLAHSVVLGNLAARSRLQVREPFEQAGEAFAPHLWWRLAAQGVREQGCAALAQG